MGSANAARMLHGCCTSPARLHNSTRARTFKRAHASACYHSLTFTHRLLIASYFRHCAPILVRPSPPLPPPSRGQVMDTAKTRMQEAVARSDEELSKSEQETADERQAKDAALRQLAAERDRTHQLEAQVAALQDQLAALQEANDGSSRPCPGLDLSHGSPASADEPATPCETKSALDAPSTPSSVSALFFSPGGDGFGRGGENAGRRKGKEGPVREELEMVRAEMEQLRYEAAIEKHRLQTAQCSRNAQLVTEIEHLKSCVAAAERDTKATRERASLLEAAGVDHKALADELVRCNRDREIVAAQLTQAKALVQKEAEGTSKLRSRVDMLAAQLEKERAAVSVADSAAVELRRQLRAAEEQVLVLTRSRDEVTDVHSSALHGLLETVRPASQASPLASGV